MATAITTSILPRNKGTHAKKRQVQQSPQTKSFTAPEYLEAHQVQAVLAAASNPRSRLLMLLQWRAGLRVSEPLAHEAADLSLDSDQPTIRVRQGKGGRSRIVPVHPELLNAMAAVLQFSQIGRGRISPVRRSTARRSVQAAVDRPVGLGAFPEGRQVGTHKFLHSYARHLLLSCSSLTATAALSLGAGLSLAYLYDFPGSPQLTKFVSPHL